MLFTLKIISKCSSPFPNFLKETSDILSSLNIGFSFPRPNGANLFVTSIIFSFVSSKREEFYKAVAETTESDSSNSLIKELHSNLENLHKSISNILTKNKAVLIIEF